MGQRVVLGYWNGSSLYVLVDTTQDEFQVVNSVYAFELAVGLGPTGLEIPQGTKRAAIFEIGGSREAMEFREVEPYQDGWLSSTSSPSGLVVPSRSSSAVSLRVVQDGYQEWNEPVVLLAGVKYGFWPLDPESQNISFGILGSNGGIEGWVQQCIAMPLWYYYDCGSRGCAYNESLNDLFLLSYCSLRGLIGLEECTSVNEAGWTDVEDAVISHVYSYCTTGKNCQTNCKSPCPDPKQECLYSGETFICKSTTESLTSGEWWKETWFIVTVVAVVLLILICTITLVYVKKEKKKEFQN